MWLNSALDKLIRLIRWGGVKYGSRFYERKRLTVAQSGEWISVF